MNIPIFRNNTIIVGTGCAAYNAADTLYNLGQKDIAIVTEGINMGTSRNTGSDKQTYYKLTLAGGGQDSVLEMAETLFAGGSMHGDIALVEAAMSARGFYKLVNLGVPFPHNEFGEFVGYKTDHDPRQRATSCGPLTSKFMTEHLEQSIMEKQIPIHDGYRVVSVLTEGTSDAKKSVGLLAVRTDDCDDAAKRFAIFACTNVVYATGGPSGLYFSSVYPESQTSATGTALAAGAKGINLTESQYGIASTKFRWNLSGTYQQVIPTYISTDADGNDAREFLDDYFETTADMVNAIFLKGYQWPFDPRKLDKNGSSIVDIAVYTETRVNGRRVFLDFRENPTKASTPNGLDMEKMNDETRDYLMKSGATQYSPIERLNHMNSLATDLYKNNGIDIETELLEIDVCAQHNNGGLMGNTWWESNLRHFFPVGEVNGTFGVYRPGGSALNSTQVGSMRAAQYIAQHYTDAPLSDGDITAAAANEIGILTAYLNAVKTSAEGKQSPMELRAYFQKKMDNCGAFIRSLSGVESALAETREAYANLGARTYAATKADITAALVNRDILLAQIAYYSAIREYIKQGGKSRGSYLISDGTPDVSVSAQQGIPAALDGDAFSGKLCEVSLNEVTTDCTFDWKPVRPIPTGYDDWFENVYNRYLEKKVIQ